MANNLVAQIVKDNDLSFYFRALFNSRGAKNPYHNIRHGLDVLIKCWEAAVWNAKEGVFGPSTFNRQLFIAALLHDIDHTGRSGDDDINVALAKRRAKKLMEQNGESLKDQTLVLHLIESTEFGPEGHTKKGSDSDSFEFLCKVLRDADLAQVFSNAWIRLLIFGLSEELGVTPRKMLELQLNFLSKLQFESRWGKEVYQDKIPEKMRETQEILSLLEIEPIAEISDALSRKGIKRV